MDLIKISDTKLKIMLTASDMDKYEISNDAVCLTDVRIHGALRKMLEDARMKSGFMIDDTRLYVQLYPSIKGGCELFICKLDDEDACYSQESGNLPSLERPALPKPYTQTRAVRKIDKYGRDVCAYSFTSLQDLIGLCRRLCSIGFCYVSNAYTDGKHKYYLFLCDFPAPSLYSLDEYCFLGEYGTRENAKLLQSYVSEYGRLICSEHAVQTLAQL